ncbi:MAG: hypothetical protein HOY76_27315 [Streptomyces sp.]|nr:hypothetical protein [Nonomuraea sp.]NUP40621.1 hypothetical protein [Streptomyces sp.]
MLGEGGASRLRRLRHPWQIAAVSAYLACVRAGAGHALIGARQWIPAEQISDPVTSITTGLPPDLTFATKGEAAIDLLRLDFVPGGEVYGVCTTLCTCLEGHGRATCCASVPSSPSAAAPACFAPRP